MSDFLCFSVFVYSEWKFWSWRRDTCICFSLCSLLSHSVMSDSVIPWTIAHQAPLSMGILQAKILEWVGRLSFTGSSQSRDQTQFSSIAGRFFTSWATREAQAVLWRPAKPSRTNTPKRCPLHYRGMEWKSRKSRATWSNRQIWPWSTKWSRSKANRILPRERTGHS